MLRAYFCHIRNGGGMSAITIQQMADRALQLLDQTGGARGGTIGLRLKRAARHQPREVRRAAERLARAAIEAEDPKLLLQIDEARVAADYDVMIRHLAAPPSSLRAVSASVGRAVLVSCALIGGVALWAMSRGA
jgi:hypothetical protein